ncbi:hypothetical protein ADU59_03085 [Pararhizobium polonicum]|uniref:Uncharacterized protein n=1 Tax=Pararhizobium polonicum TaxID=1612624 RepID=A0A1C7P650_9HYPH|nr:hypothetical protein [Pararhizobium polonicum]OBZ96739.1 hypothetical protein ADU59_03085 [Pararhizobium polonicum]
MTKASYFAVDRRAWRAACGLGMNEAVAYLVIAAGTGADQRTSGWSATAIEKYTGIHHRRAAAAISVLQGAGLATVEKRGKLRRYLLVPVDQVATIVGVTAGKTRSKDACRSALDQLANPEWIWLPNSLVEGAGNETPPVKLLRQTQDLNALRLFVDLYYHHDLAGSGGVEWRKGIGIRQLYERKPIGEHGIYKIWGFQPSTTQTFRDVPYWFEGFWAAWDILRDAGLVEFVAHLVESDGADAEIVHPLPWGNGEKEEIAITIAALEAGRAMAPFFSDDRTLLVPVSRLRPNVQLIGVARMKYRPQTARTAEWLSNAPEWRKTAMAFEELRKASSDSGIKVVSR